MVGSYVKKGVRLGHNDLDILDLEKVREFFKREKPTVVLDLAAATNMRRCEEERDHAYSVNAIGTYHVALATREVGAKLVYVSSGAIFDGTKKGPYTTNDLPNPVNGYGLSKYLGECAVRSVSDNYLIVRSSWIFGGGPKYEKKFVGLIAKQLQSKEILAVDDVVGNPTYAKDLVKAIMLAIARKERGIIHFVNAGKTTRFEVAKFIVEIFESKAKVRGVPLSYFNPTGNTLHNESLRSSLHLRSWRDALREYLNNEWR